MNLYLIYQLVNQDYDTYDSAVVVAECEDDAKKIHPRGRKVRGLNPITGLYDLPWWKGEDREFSWAYKLDDVKVELIGIADNSLRAGDVICASFNAG